MYRHEIEILKDLKHENIILMLDFFETKTDFCVVTEYAQGELFDILEDDHRYVCVCDYCPQELLFS